MRFLNKIKLFSNRARHSSKNGSKIERDWKLILIISAIVLMAGVAVDSNLFIRVNKLGKLSERAFKDSRIVRDRKFFTETINFFENQKNEYQLIKSSPKNEIDPSL